MIGNKEQPEFLSLYIHIPFCSKKCPYCHFYVLKTRQETKSHFLKALKRELFQSLDLMQSRPIVSIYLGGGTPSQLSVCEINDLLDFLLKLPLKIAEDCEITMEANPEDLSPLYLKELAQTPVNRLSIGVQSFNESSLQNLSRQHSSQKAINSIETAYESGIKNISIDLMYELPHQTYEDFQYSINQAAKLPISHLSLYNLTIEPKTAFFKKQDQLKPFLPNDKIAKSMLDYAVSHLEHSGLNHYEISAFSKPGYHSKHNTGYWLGREFLGFGPSAFSFYGKKRFRNIANINTYIKNIENNSSPIDFEETLNPQAQIKELIAINLRLKEGCNLSKYPTWDFLEQTIEKLSQENYLEKEGSTIRLTEKGRNFYDDVGLYFVD